MAAQTGWMAPAGLPPSLASLQRTAVMGIVNVTPDSFSDGGRHDTTDAAVSHGLRLWEEGADLIDVGGESTRPGAAPVSLQAEQDRVLPVVSALADRGVPVSIDTMHAETARAAVNAGAFLINDVSGGLADPRMLPTIADLQVPCILMHWRMDEHGLTHAAHYRDVVAEVSAELAQRIDFAIAAGVHPTRIVLDPGLGFAKEAEHNWAALRGLTKLAALGYPLIVGASRKRFLGSLLQAADGTPRESDAREDATTALSALCAAQGVWAVRVHRAAGSSDAVRVAAAWRGDAHA
jgi:dihydropteroate synthase